MELFSYDSFRTGSRIYRYARRSIPTTHSLRSGRVYDVPHLVVQKSRHFRGLFDKLEGKKDIVDKF